MSTTALHCTILGTIAAFWIKLLATPSPPATPPHPSHADVHVSNTHTHMHTHSLSSHPLSSYNPLVKPSLSMRTPHPEGPRQGKLGWGGGFCFAAHSEKKKIQIISWAGAIWHAVITALSKNFFDISEREDFHKTRAPFRNSLGKKRLQLIRLFNYALFTSLSVYLASLSDRGKNKLAPSELVLALITFL